MDSFNERKHFLNQPKPSKSVFILNSGSGLAVDVKISVQLMGDCVWLGNDSRGSVFNGTFKIVSEAE